MDVDARAAAIASRQLGLITRAQARGAGMSVHQIDRRVRSGVWQRRHPGVFAVAGAPRTWEQRALAAVLASGDGGVLSHRAAARLHGLLGGRPRPEISVPRHRQPRLEGVRVHRVQLPPADVAQVTAIPVTTAARTIADCAGLMTPRRLTELLDDALVRGLCDVADITRVLDRLGSGRGRRSVLLRSLLAERGAEAHKAESPPEARVYRVLVAAGLPAPVQQHPVTIAGERFRLDLAYPDALLGLEYMGFDPHRSRSAHDRDFRRDRLLSGAGWTILYFTAATTDAEIVAAVRPLVRNAA